LRNQLSSRALGTNPRARQIAARDLGVNPRNLGVSPRQVADLTEAEIAEKREKIRAAVELI
jgi:hypothetical protein